MRLSGSRRSLLKSVKSLLLLILTIFSFTLFIALRAPLHLPPAQSAAAFALKKTADEVFKPSVLQGAQGPTSESSKAHGGGLRSPLPETTALSTCATVEEMGSVFDGDGVWKETLRVRRLIRRHFEVNGASAVQNLPSDQFCRCSFVIGKASEAVFGNEMYKILTAAALSIMLNRSLITGQTRHIGANIYLGNISRTQISHLV